jgi:hypothetical protein
MGPLGAMRDGPSLDDKPEQIEIDQIEMHPRNPSQFTKAAYVKC